MSEFKLTIKHPHLPDGTEIEVDGVGSVENGSSVTVTQAMQDAYRNANEGIELKAALAQSGITQFNGKDKLVDGAMDLKELEDQQAAESQAAKNEGGDK